VPAGLGGWYFTPSHDWQDRDDWKGFIRATFTAWDGRHFVVFNSTASGGARARGVDVHTGDVKWATPAQPPGEDQDSLELLSIDALGDGTWLMYEGTGMDDGTWSFFDPATGDTFGDLMSIIWAMPDSITAHRITPPGAPDSLLFTFVEWKDGPGFTYRVTRLDPAG
jgi:hypothetical protein